MAAMPELVRTCGKAAVMPGTDKDKGEGAASSSSSRCGSQREEEAALVCGTVGFVVGLTCGAVGAATSFDCCYAVGDATRRED